MPTLPAAAEPRVSILIAAARRPDRLLRCLAAVERQTPATIAIEVVVVLNAAEPELRATVRDEVEGATVIESTVPLGFAGAVNLGARAARGELLLVLHDDTEVRPSWLDALTECLETHPQAGAAGSVLLDATGALQSAGSILWSNGNTSAWLSGSTGPWPRGLEEPFPVDYVSSASLLARREVWDAVGGFDEDFHPAYYVDVDFALGVQRLGLTVLCEPRSLVVHEKGGTSRPGFSAFVAARNRERLLVKWASELERQPSFAEGDEALARAQLTARHRTAELETVPPLPGRASTPPAPETRVERLEREHLQLRRELELRVAYAEALEGAAATNEERLRAADAARGELAAELERASAERERVSADHERVSAELAHARGELQRLRERDHVLTAIEAGGWWRLRGRILPLLRLATRARALSRRAGSSRTG
jgi:GT2 family glycosyltransferase